MVWFRDEAISRSIQNAAAPAHPRGEQNEQTSPPRCTRKRERERRREWTPRESMPAATAASGVAQFDHLSLNFEGPASSPGHPCGRRSEDEQSVETFQVWFSLHRRDWSACTNKRAYSRVYAQRGLKRVAWKHKQGVGGWEVRFVILWPTPGGTHDVQFDIPRWKWKDRWKIDSIVDMDSEMLKLDVLSEVTGFYYLAAPSVNNIWYIVLLVDYSIINCLFGNSYFYFFIVFLVLLGKYFSTYYIISCYLLICFTSYRIIY